LDAVERCGYSGKDDLSRRKFGRLRVKRYVGFVRDKRTGRRKDEVWKCRCRCGRVKFVRGTCLRRGLTLSCGCLQKERARAAQTTHGLRKTKIYNVWNQLVQRCTNENNTAYKDYGGRGITVCPEWMTFENFYMDMGNPPPGKTLDRKDNDGPYSKDNCRWVSRTVQANNRRGLRLITFRGKTQSLRWWCKRLDLNYHRMYYDVVTRGKKFRDALKERGVSRDG
jgi:hypothetical protein